MDKTRLETFSKYYYLVLAFILGAIPAVSFIHIFAKDFVSYYTLSQSFLTEGAYSFAKMAAYGTERVGLQARAPLLSVFLTISTFLFGKSLFSIYLPILISRLLITPLTYLVSKRFLPVEVAFLASTMTIFFPRLQTFSLSAFEADSFVLVLFLFALLSYFYFKEKSNKVFLILCGFFLGLLTLVKELGLPISAGFITGVAIEMSLNKSLQIRNKMKIIAILVVPFLLIVAPYFLFTILKGGSFYFSAVSSDRNIKYIPKNLPFLVGTFPIYMGLEELGQGLVFSKTFLINFAILLLSLIGILSLLFKKNHIVVFPLLFTVFVFGSISSNALGGKIPGNFELISIFAFVMPIIAIFVFYGLGATVSFTLGKIKGLGKFQNYIFFILSLVLMFKFINNFFAKPSTLDFAGEYYINLSTVISDKKQLPKYSFQRDTDGNLIVSDLLALNTFMKNEYKAERVEVFSSSFKFMILSVVLSGIIFAFFVKFLETKELLHVIKKR